MNRSIQFGWGLLSLGQKFSLLQISLAIVFLGIFLFEFTQVTNRFSDEQLNERIKQNNDIVNNFVSYLVEDNLDTLIKQLDGSFTLHFGGLRNYTINGRVKLENGVEAPNLMLNGISLANSFELLDRFRATTEADVTIFARNGDSFIRIATTLKDTNGNRAIGTQINATHPAYTLLIQKKDFYGRLELFGRENVAVYRPIVGLNGDVVGILFATMNLEKFYHFIQQSLKGVKVGEKGEVLVLDKKHNKFIIGFNGARNTFSFYSDFNTDSGFVDFNSPGGGGG